MKNGGALAVFVLMLFLAAPLARAQESDSASGVPTWYSPTTEVTPQSSPVDLGPQQITTYDASGTSATTTINPAASPSSGANTSQTFVPLAPIPNLTQGGVAVNTSGLAQFLNNLYVYLIGLAAVLAVIEIIIGGLEIATQDSVSKHAQGRSRIQQAVFGLVLVLSPVVVFSIINPGILNLSLAIPPIDLSASGNTGGGGGSGGSSNTPQISTTESGVTQSVTGTYLKTATFSSNDADANNEAAKNWATQCAQQGAVFNAVEKSSACNAYVNGACSSASPATAQCSFTSSASYTFLAVSDNKLKATDGAGSQFIASCQSEGGTVCTNGLVSSGKITCPSELSIPSTAPNAQGGGICWNEAPVCLAKVSDINQYCQGSITFTQ